MNFTNIIKKLFLFGAMATGLAATSCTDELAVEEPGGGLQVVDGEVEGDCIAFTINLDKSLTSRDGGPNTVTSSGVNIDDYINVQSMFRVFFFTEKGDFLFGAIDRTVTAVSTSGSMANNYYVRVPMNYLVDRDGREYDLTLVKDYLKKNKFKVAVLANWPNSGYYNPADPPEGEESGSTGGNQNVSQQTPGAYLIVEEPKWGYVNSIFYKERYDQHQSNASSVPNFQDYGTPDLKNINDLHHLMSNSYKSAKNDGYSAFYKNNGEQGLMGVTKDWVKRRDVPSAWKASYAYTELPCNSKDEAEVWIRQNWSPKKSENKDANGNPGIYRQYEYLWKRWDFAGSYATTPNENDRNKRRGETLQGRYAYDTNEVNDWGKEWWFRNGQELKNWMNGLPGTQNLTMSDPEAEAQFKYTKYSSGTNLSRNGSYNGMTGIQMSSGAGEFTFVAHSSGTLRIKMCSANGSEANMRAETSNDDGDGSNKTFKNSTYNISSTDPQYWDINITGKELTMKITCTKGTAIIYCIEYIRAKYFYDSDREGVFPTEQDPIPMYGVQNYDKLSDWEEGTTYDLSQTINHPDYGHKSISLIRSVAKVLVHFPKDGQTVKHIYLRSMNRTAFCEPIDVETPTLQLWGPHDPTHCEWFNIFNYGFGYDSSQTGSTNKDNPNVSSFRNWMSWFYGSWRTASWKRPANGTGNYTGWNFNNVGLSFPTTAQKNGFNTLQWSYVDGNGETQSGQRSDNYPHIYNPHVNRSDYCHFIELDDPNYQTFVLYVPEKNIDDSNTVGWRGDISKVAHIEYRYEGMSEDNLDDNNCYRIYFTQYLSGNPNIRQNTNIATIEYNEFDKYERNQLTSGTNANKQGLGEFWPIMRNHVYEFYIEDTGPSAQEVRVKVSDWGHEKVTLEW